MSHDTFRSQKWVPKLSCGIQRPRNQKFRWLGWTSLPVSQDQNLSTCPKWVGMESPEIGILIRDHGIRADQNKSSRLPALLRRSGHSGGASRPHQNPRRRLHTARHCIQHLCHHSRHSCSRRILYTRAVWRAITLFPDMAKRATRTLSGCRRMRWSDATQPSKL